LSYEIRGEKTDAEFTTLEEQYEAVEEAVDELVREFCERNGLTWVRS